ncbi:hypothetical protein Q4493_12440 [Colwellia sp. 1_MG-2023]|uniref:hypothetical protein n=1 Tax=Colwellia sp. 1_MG-2023 TaxID=3062649 RepID=UPI0026E257D3|nr:hypothetical protein [Colwellia sp. 1_MG-2023]MDO6446584.1 hypothetical protein [Colwellia sp. 1_MG-2023]
MQNSTQWCNLYSVESKYNIRVGQSAVQRIIKRWFDAVIILLFCHIVSQLYWAITIATSANLVAIIAFLFICNTILFKKYYNRLPIYQIKHLVLHENGLIDCDRYNHLSLHINSRIGWLGCWLILIDNSSKILGKPIKIFIFKDSLSQQDYCRLSRTILSNHRQQPASSSTI